ncbi:fungal-specific transcription factor domain-containing protein [Fusarium solani]|uniref:Fungal-specific transcription factor domain-containing protein n=1 Tax=Fusarium solani TaxID=169388 RepID=A0A9P9GQN6_FUSSL|nr:fungal-specific transcription factor domain-containing protein [Fusarium solani]KAH7242972.1 fungal-specific transcription factor domain-containing protein [Fusarium solani]
MDYPSAAAPSNAQRDPLPSSRKTGVRSKYAPKACQECRRRRAKCDGANPAACSRCVGRQLTCVYTTEDDARGTAPKSYVRLLQARISVLEKILWLHSIDVDASAAQLMQQNTVPATATSLTAGGSTAAFDQLRDAFEGILSLDESHNFDQDGQARYFGPASGRLDFKACNDEAGDSPKEYSPLPADLYVQTLGAQHGVDEELEAHLIEQYFTWEQPWLQVIDEALFRESRENNGRYFSPLLLNCILALGSRFSDRTEVRSDPNDPNTAGRLFLETAEVLLHFDLKRPSITTIQSLAVLGTAYHAFGQDAAGWLHSGMANRLILDMGLHLDPGSLVISGHMTTEEAELRRQIYWSLYCVDKLSAGYTGRVCTMLDFQGAVGMPTVPTHAQQCDDRHTLYSVRPELLISLQTALIRLCQILEKIILNLYAPKKLSLVDQRRDYFDSCLLSLKSWFYGLCTELKPIQGGAPNQFPQAYTLCMVYHTAVILLARPYIQSKGLAHSAADPLVQKATAIFLEAARAIPSLGDQYRLVFDSFRRSPITATYANLCAALALLSPQNQYRARFNQADNSKLKSCIQTLQELSTAWMPPGKYRCSLLKTIQNHPAFQQRETPTSSALTDDHDDSQDSTSGAIRMSDSMQPANNLWDGPSVDNMGWPSWMSVPAGDSNMAEFLATAESLPSQPGSNVPWEQFDLSWFGSSLPEGFSSS